MINLILALVLLLFIIVVALVLFNIVWWIGAQVLYILVLGPSEYIKTVWEQRDI